MSNQSHKRKSSMGFGEGMMWLAGVLFCLVLITTAMMGGLFARYITSATGSDSARVVVFGNLTLTETGDFDGTENKKGMIIPGVTLTKDATVTFTGSEAATLVFVEVIVPEDTWEMAENGAFSYGGLSWTVASGWEYLDSDHHAGNDRYVFYKTLEPNTQLNQEKIVHEGKILVSEEITKATIAGLANGDLAFRASVIQAGGFKTVEEAWAAMAAK